MIYVYILDIIIKRDFAWQVFPRQVFARWDFVWLVFLVSARYSQSFLLAFFVLITFLVGGNFGPLCWLLFLFEDFLNIRQQILHIVYYDDKSTCYDLSEWCSSKSLMT